MRMSFSVLGSANCGALRLVGRYALGREPSELRYGGYILGCFGKLVAATVDVNLPTTIGGGGPSFDSPFEGLDVLLRPTVPIPLPEFATVIQ
jgi:hypothetical protein